MDAAGEELLALAESSRAALRRDEPDAERPILERYAEFEQAMDRCLEQGDDAAAARLACALVSFWLATGRLDDGARWFERLFAVPRPPAEVWARALHEQGYLVFWAGNYDLARSCFTRSRQMAENLGDRSVHALALAGLARVELNSDPAQAVRLLRRALEITEDDRSDDEGRSSAVHVLGVALQMSGDLDGARTVIAERLARAHREGDRFVVWTESANLSTVERQLGNLERAEELSRQAIATDIAQSRDLFLAWTLNGLAAVTAARGDLVRAATIIGSATVLLARAGGEWPPDEREQYDQTVALLNSCLTHEEHDRAHARGAEMTRETIVDFALNGRSMRDRPPPAAP